MTFTLRQATASDEAFLFSLHVATMRESVTATWGWNDEWQKQHFSDHFAPERTKIILVSGKSAGMIELDIRPKELFVTNLKILPEFQRAGLGTSVLRYVILSAAGQAFPVRLQVLLANTRARRLYERLGFRETGQTKTHAHMELGSC